MRQQSNRWIIRLVTASCLGTALFCAPRVEAAEHVQMAMAAPSDEDLLMFWEEKELYVQTATRSEKPIAQVAENMTVITAKEIEAMNANSVAEVLARLPGLFVQYQINDFVSPAQLSIQGSEARHVTVLLDGMPVNDHSEGKAELSFIPVRIIERIEIIKGAASSAWGSALGGVINIITRSTGDKATPNGMLSVSWGEADSRDLAAELRGKNGPLGYYLYAGQQDSDGLLNNRDYQRSSVFAKLFLTPTRDLDITLSGGYGDPKTNTGLLQSSFGVMKAKLLLRNKFLNGTLEYRATPELTVRGGLYLFNTYSDVPTRFTADNTLVNQNIFDQQSMGGNLRATWSSGIQTLTVGSEMSHGSMDETSNAGPLYQSFGLPPTVSVAPTVDRWGIFANDTVEFGPLAVTPGIRLDHDSITGYFVSPSLGVTWELGEHTVARASAARGFTSPPLGYTRGQGLFYRPNPDLKAEFGWSYQVGLESGLGDLVNLKGTLFRHETSDAITATRTTSLNQGDVTRQGYELEADTVPFYNLSLKLGHAYTHVKGDRVILPNGAVVLPNGHSNPYFDNYSWLVGIKYDDRRSFSAQLSGSYVYWDLEPAQEGKYTTFIWDLTGTKRFQLNDWSTLECFLTVHNIFSGHYYTTSAYPNPGRWVEGGLKFKF